MLDRLQRSQAPCLSRMQISCHSPVTRLTTSILQLPLQTATTFTTQLYKPFHDYTKVNIPIYLMLTLRVSWRARRPSQEGKGPLLREEETRQAMRQWEEWLKMMWQLRNLPGVEAT
jgi:hypothetical protein